jgi:hypothetical protein
MRCVLTNEGLQATEHATKEEEGRGRKRRVEEIKRRRWRRQINKQT